MHPWPILHKSVRHSLAHLLFQIIQPLHNFYDVSQQLPSFCSIFPCSETQFIFCHCYISPEIGYLFSWTSLKAKTGPLCCCVSVEVDGRGRGSDHRLPTGGVLTVGSHSRRKWLPLQGRPLWWGSWRFSHRVREAPGSPEGIRHPSAGFSLQGCGVKKQRK